MTENNAKISTLSLIVSLLSDMSFGKNGTSKSVGIKMSTWTPQSNGEAKEQMFHERRDLVTKWWSKWNGQQRQDFFTKLMKNL